MEPHVLGLRHFAYRQFRPVRKLNNYFADVANMKEKNPAGHVYL